MGAGRAGVALLLAVSVFAAEEAALPPSGTSEGERPVAVPAAAIRRVDPDPALLVEDPEVAALLRDLFMRAGAGTSNNERAAFLVRERSGRWGCLLWPAKGRFRSESFEGAVPSGTVAIIHTHPNQIVRASQQDRESALRTGLPLFTLTWGNITVVDPASGAERWIVRRTNWGGAVEASLRRSCRCREIGTPEKVPLPGSLMAGAGQ